MRSSVPLPWCSALHCAGPVVLATGWVTAGSWSFSLLKRPCSFTPVWVLASFGRPYARLHTQIYSTSFRKDLHLLLNAKRHVQKISVTLFISGWSTHCQISSERHASPTWLFACSWHYSSVRVSPPRACCRGCHGYQALCITVMSTDSPLKCHWPWNGCCNPSKPHPALDGECLVLWVISCLYM